MHLLASPSDEFEYWLPNSTASLFLFLNFCLQVVIGIRVIMQRRPTGETLAWIMVVFSMPFLGPLRLPGARRVAARPPPGRAVHRAHQAADVLAPRHPPAEPRRLELARGRLQAARRNVRADDRRAGARRQPRRPARRLAAIFDQAARRHRGRHQHDPPRVLHLERRRRGRRGGRRA